MTMIALYRDVRHEKVRIPANGWRHDDEATFIKLVASVRRYGQLRPVVVRMLEGTDGDVEVIDGRRLARAAKEAGLEHVRVADLGYVPDEDAVLIALALETCFDVDYAKLAFAVAALLEKGLSAQELASRTPFTAERINYFGVLSKFDWSQFAAAKTDQHAMDWDGGDVGEEPPLGDPPAPEPEQVLVSPTPVPETVQRITHAEPAPVLETVDDEPSLFDEQGTLF